MTAVSLAGPRIPNATVLPAPAASHGAVVAAMGSAGSGSTDAAAMLGLAAATPGIATLDVPAEYQARLDGAVATGRADGAAFARLHTKAERWMIPDWALLKLGWPPKDDAPELAYLRTIAGTRTPEGIAAARHWAEHGLTEEWDKYLDQYAAKAGPKQALAARKLLDDSLMMVNTVTQTAKAASLRKRPFVVDPSLPLAVDKPGNSPSYPSGHTSAAYAACLVLAHLMPDRASEFLGIARQASWARIYAGVHFPTDVLAGARLAATVSSYVIRTGGATPVRGTDPGINPGVAGGRRRLDGAAQLAGPRIAGGGSIAA